MGDNQSKYHKQVSCWDPEYMPSQSKFNAYVKNTVWKYEQWHKRQKPSITRKKVTEEQNEEVHIYIKKKDGNKKGFGYKRKQG